MGIDVVDLPPQSLFLLVDLIDKLFEVDVVQLRIHVAHAVTDSLLEFIDIRKDLGILLQVVLVLQGSRQKPVRDVMVVGDGIQFKIRLNFERLQIVYVVFSVNFRSFLSIVSPEHPSTRPARGFIVC